MQTRKRWETWNPRKHEAIIAPAKIRSKGDARYHKSIVRRKFDGDRYSLDTMNLIFELIEKDTPQRVGICRTHKGYEAVCPNCGEKLIDIFVDLESQQVLHGVDHCKYCGQRLEDEWEFVR